MEMICAVLLLCCAPLCCGVATGGFVGDGEGRVDWAAAGQPSRVACQPCALPHTEIASQSQVCLRQVLWCYVRHVSPRGSRVATGRGQDAAYQLWRQKHSRVTSVLMPSNTRSGSRSDLAVRQASWATRHLSLQHANSAIGFRQAQMLQTLLNTFFGEGNMSSQVKVFAGRYSQLFLLHLFAAVLHMSCQQWVARGCTGPRGSGHRGWCNRH